MAAAPQSSRGTFGSCHGCGGDVAAWGGGGREVGVCARGGKGRATQVPSNTHTTAVFPPLPPPTTPPTHPPHTPVHGKAQHRQDAANRHLERELPAFPCSGLGREAMGTQLVARCEDLYARSARAKQCNTAQRKAGSSAPSSMADSSSRPTILTSPSTVVVTALVFLIMRLWICRAERARARDIRCGGDDGELASLSTIILVMPPPQPFTPPPPSPLAPALTML